MGLRHKVLSKTGSTRGTAYTMSNKVLTHEGKTHVVWLDQIRNIYVRTFHHQARRWSKPVFVGEGDDNHAGAALAMDSEGFLHLVFGPHHNPIQHAISARPNTSTSWVMQPVLGGSAATYPSLVCDAEDTLHVCYRGAFADERPRSLMYQRRPKGGAWSDPVQLVNPEGPLAYTQFENALYVGKDGTLFLSYHIVRAWEADHKEICGRGFGVMMSRDGGMGWQTVDGEALFLPTTPDSPCVIEFDENLDVRMGNIVCDGSGHPFFSLNRREGDFWQTLLYRRRRNQWEAVPLFPEVERVFGDCEMSDVCALSISEDGVLYAAGVVCPRGGGWAASGNEVVLFTSHDSGDTFSTYAISKEDPRASNWLPSVERCTGHNRVDVPGLVYTHGEKGEGCSPDVDTEICFVSLEQVARDEAAEVTRAVAGVEHLSGLAFTEEQRKKIRRRVEGYRANYQALRDVEVGYDVEPPTVFLPGVAPGGEATSFRLCDGGSVDRPTSDEELAFLPVSKLARLIESRAVSPVELARLYLDRLHAYGPGLHCVVTVTEDLALKQAKVAEAEI
ncbi:MAG: BNR-4 repeat-containing protein, partial [bacterium]|nr:BNR-4 repeat-containing protein [bacterium]